LVGDGSGVLVGDDAGPQAVRDVRCQSIDRPLVTVERDGVPAAVGQPVAFVERGLEACGAFAPRLGRAVPAGVREFRASEVRRVHVALHLAERDRGLGDPSGRVVDPVEGILPALVGQAAVGAALVLDEAVAVAIAVPLDPGQRPVGGGHELLPVAGGQAPPVQLTEQRHEQRGGIRRAVVGGATPEGQLGLASEPHLVQDPAGLFLGEWLLVGPLVLCERLEGAEGKALVQG
jgi:hypothetical protein